MKPDVGNRSVDCWFIPSSLTLAPFILFASRISLTILFYLQYVKVIFEIGHEASVRNKRTPEGFTHDWELFVRGAENTDIHFFIDKVVFHLHDTFPNPKRGKFYFLPNVF